MVEMAPLDEFIDMAKVECLNQCEAHPVQHALEDGDNFLSSDVDPDLLVKVEFRQPVKLSHITIQGTGQDESYPQELKIFQGKPDIGFEAKDDAATQEMVLDPASVAEGTKQETRFVKFQCVQTLQLFLTNDQDQTQVKRIRFYGSPAAKSDMKEWKPLKG